MSVIQINVSSLHLKSGRQCFTNNFLDIHVQLALYPNLLAIWHYKQPVEVCMLVGDDRKKNPHPYNFRNKRPVGLIAPPFKINFLATKN